MNRRDALKAAAVFPFIAKALADTPTPKTPDMPTIGQIRTSPDHFKNAVEATVKAIISKRPDARIWRIIVQMGRYDTPNLCYVYLDDDRCFVSDPLGTAKPRPVERGPAMEKILKQKPQPVIKFRNAAFCVDFNEVWADATEFVFCIDRQITESIKNWQFTGLYEIRAVNAYQWRT